MERVSSVMFDKAAGRLAQGIKKQVGEARKRQEWFPVTKIHRDDLGVVGFDASEVDDNLMEQLADNMRTVCVDMLYWESLQDIAADLGFPKAASKEAI